MFKFIKNLFNSKNQNKLTKLEIINETVEFYSANPTKLRSTSKKGGCAYNGENDTHCAIGRCLLPKYQEQGNELKGNSNGLKFFLDINSLKLDEVLQENYRGHEYPFWLALQNLHDESYLWCEKGLTESGKEYVETLIKTYK